MTMSIDLIDFIVLTDAVWSDFVRLHWRFLTLIDLHSMRISQKGLYALQALTVLARQYPGGVVKIHDIAREEDLPEKFLEAILRDLKHLRVVKSTRGANGGYQLNRAPEKIFLGEVLRRIDGPLAPFEDAESLRQRVRSDPKHRPLFKVLLEVRDATARIMDHTSVADLCK